MASQTQAVTLNQIRRKLNSLSSRRYTDEDLRIFINEGLRDMSRRAESNRATATIAITANTKTVTAPVDTVRIHTVQYTPSNQTQVYELEYIDPKNAASITWQNTTQGRPSYFWTWGYPPNLTIEVNPMPAEAGNLIVQYYNSPVPLALDDTDANTTLTCPQGWEDLVVDYSVYQALLSDADDRWQSYKAEYESKLSAFADAAIRYVDQSGSIQVGSSVVPEWLWNPSS